MQSAVSREDLTYLPGPDLKSQYTLSLSLSPPSPPLAAARTANAACVGNQWLVRMMIEFHSFHIPVGTRTDVAWWLVCGCGAAVLQCWWLPVLWVIGGAGSGQLESERRARARCTERCIGRQTEPPIQWGGECAVLPLSCSHTRRERERAAREML